jgi:hypothetical protein
MRFYKTAHNYVCPTLAHDEETGVGYADPCYVVPDARKAEFLPLWIAASKTVPKGQTYTVSFDSVTLRCQDTGSDGFFPPGVAVDTGCLAEFDFAQMVAAWDPLLLPA